MQENRKTGEHLRAARSRAGGQVVTLLDTHPPAFEREWLLLVALVDDVQHLLHVLELLLFREHGVQ